ncbi:hypothetical protein ANO11243_057120 [Dothideomycetidae sp. 11243]|nr:hypothetical protein ANO11243_057120 [fungal sp. No.11243]
MDPFSTVLDVSSTVPLTPPFVDFDSASNVFVGMSIPQIEDFVRQHQKTLRQRFYEVHTFIVIDDESVHKGDCVLLRETWERKNEVPTSIGFKKARIPRWDACNIVLNLSVGNMAFYDFCEEPDLARGEMCKEANKVFTTEYIKVSSMVSMKVTINVAWKLSEKLLSKALSRVPNKVFSKVPSKVAGIRSSKVAGISSSEAPSEVPCEVPRDAWSNVDDNTVNELRELLHTNHEAKLPHV